MVVAPFLKNMPAIQMGELSASAAVPRHPTSGAIAAVKTGKLKLLKNGTGEQTMAQLIDADIERSKEVLYGQFYKY